MDLILWRHAEAHEHPELLTGRPGDAQDMARRLTSRGEKQAARMAEAMGFLDEKEDPALLDLIDYLRPGNKIDIYFLSEWSNQYRPGMEQ